jgi:hypothetical protein
VEEVVLRSSLDAEADERFRRERDRLYEVEDADCRQRSFAEQALTWFEYLGFGARIQTVLIDYPLLQEGIERCMFLRTASRSQEGSELFVSSEDATKPCCRALAFRFRAESFLDQPTLNQMLHRELLHTHDMLDEAFGYCPNWPSDEHFLPYRPVLVDRYRLLWDITVNGRNLLLGRASRQAGEVCFAEFSRIFASLGEETRKWFDFFADHPSPTHDLLKGFAERPGSNFTECCSLCGLPTRDLLPEFELHDEDLLHEIRQQHPDWQTLDPVCRQCAMLVRSRPLSEAALMELPHPRS